MIKHIAKTSWLLALLIAILLPHLTYAQALPPIPYEDSGACPFECCVYKEWTVNEETALHEYRSNDSPVVFTVKPNEKVQGVTGVVVTTTPGEVRIDRPMTIEFYSDRNSDPPQTILVQPGDIIYLLTYHGEGYFTAWFKGQVMNVDVWGLEEADSNIRLNRRHGKSIWWVKIKNRQGQIGWTDQSDHFGNQYGC
jgi:hypothetical protein